MGKLNTHVPEFHLSNKFHEIVCLVNSHCLSSYGRQIMYTSTYKPLHCITKPYRAPQCIQQLFRTATFIVLAGIWYVTYTRTVCSFNTYRRSRQPDLRVAIERTWQTDCRFLRTDRCVKGGTLHTLLRWEIICTMLCVIFPISFPWWYKES